MNGKDVSQEFFSVVDAGKYTGSSPWTWRQMAYRGKVASVKLGTRLLIPRAEVERVMRQGTRPARDSK